MTTLEQMQALIEDYDTVLERRNSHPNFDVEYARLGRALEDLQQQLDWQAMVRQLLPIALAADALVATLNPSPYDELGYEAELKALADALKVVRE